MKIFDGETDASPMLGLYCGNLIPPMHISSGNAIFIRFETNVVDTGLGFKMEYHATSKPNLINFELPFKASLLNDGAKWNRLPYLISLLHLLLDCFNLRQILEFLAYLLIW